MGLTGDCMPTARDSSGRKLVVVIDRDPLVRDAMAGLLQSWGFEVVAAAWADAALARLAEDKLRPDLIIADYRLRGGATGLEAIQQLRGALASPIPALVIMGEIAPHLQSEAEADGCVVLQKPVHPAMLRKLLDEILGE